VRPFNSYGPRCHHEGDSGEVIPKFMLRALAGKPLLVFGDGAQTRDFTFVEDTARGILLAAKSPKAVGETFNLGSGSEITINALARAVARAAGRPAKVLRVGPRPGDVGRLYADSCKARRLLGFRPRIALAEGLLRLNDWYRRSGSSPAELLRGEKDLNWRL
jgi:UDP-glucose 4-epimerase